MKSNLIIHDLQNQNKNHSEYINCLLIDLEKLNRIYNDSESMNSEQAEHIQLLNSQIDKITNEYNTSAEQMKSEIDELTIDKDSFCKDVSILREDILY